MFISNNRPSFHLWWKENLVKHQKVSTYYETDSSFVILYSTHRSLKTISCNWSTMGKETNSSLDTFTERIIFDFLLSRQSSIFYFLLNIFSPHSTTKFFVLRNIKYFSKRSSYQFLAFKDLCAQTNLRNKFLRNFTKPYDPLLNFDLHT